MKRKKRISRKRLIVSSIEMAVNTARKFHREQRFKYDLSVLESIALEGLCLAGKKFKRKHKSGTPFGGYANKVIRSQLTKYSIAQNRRSRKVDQPKFFVTDDYPCAHEQVDTVEVFSLAKGVLTKKQYRIVERMFIDGLPKADVARELQINIETFNKRLEVILRLLREQFPKLEILLD